MLCTEIVSDIQNNFCTYNMFSPCSAKRRASDKDLPVRSTGGSKRIVMPQNMFYDSKIVEQNNKQTKRNIYCTRLYGVKV